MSKVKEKQVFKALQQAGIDLEAGAIEPLVPPMRASRRVELSAPRAEFMRLYLAIDALRVQDRSFVLQFVASSDAEGTSSVAAQFARTAALERGRPVLLVDCADTGGEGGPPELLQSSREAQPLLELATSASPAGYHKLRLSKSRYPLLDPGAVQHALSRARAEFPITVLDCPSIARDPQAAALARFCDGTVLVVRADAAKQRDAKRARDEIIRQGGQLLGVVFNRWRSYIPEALSRYLE